MSQFEAAADRRRTRGVGQVVTFFFFSTRRYARRMYCGVSEQELLLKVFAVPAKNFEANGQLFRYSVSVAQVSVVEARAPT